MNTLVSETLQHKDTFNKYHIILLAQWWLLETAKGKIIKEMIKWCNILYKLVNKWELVMLIRIRELSSILIWTIIIKYIMQICPICQ